MLVSMLAGSALAGDASSVWPPGAKVIAGEWERGPSEVVATCSKGGESILLLPTRSEAVRVRAQFRFERGSERQWIGVRLGAAKASSEEGGRRPAFHQVTVRRELGADNAVEHAVRYGGDRPRWNVRVKTPAPKDAAAKLTHTIDVRRSEGRIVVSIDGRPALDSIYAADLVGDQVALVANAPRVAWSGISCESLAPDVVARLGAWRGPLRRVSVIAHRGSSVRAPENTLAALQLAMDERAPAVEFDVYTCRGGEVVLLHDHDVLRTTNFRQVFGEDKSAEVTDLTFEELLRLDAGAWKSPRYRGEKIPTLRAALRELIDGGAVPVIEIKPDDIGRAVARVVAELESEPAVFVQSFSPRAIAEFRELAPSVPTGLLIGGTRGGLPPEDLAKDHLLRARRAGASALVVHNALVSPDYVRVLHRRAMTLWVYTVNSPLEWEALIRCGVDGLISDLPAELNSFLDAGGADS